MQCTSGECTTRASLSLSLTTWSVPLCSRLASLFLLPSYSWSIYLHALSLFSLQLTNFLPSSGLGYTRTLLGQARSVSLLLRIQFKTKVSCLCCINSKPFLTTKSLIRAKNQTLLTISNKLSSSLTICRQIYTYWKEQKKNKDEFIVRCDGDCSKCLNGITNQLV